ncbi:MAG: hypothetical protein SGI77_07740 [Pirellulaceae bacterium]|nr:hypothetical protein [Pirellulaceae bacterium]
MIPSELDDALLTAYLDDELSQADREIVERELKSNIRWQSLLAELKSVRNLIRELPKPVLSRSITSGIWNQPTEQESSKQPLKNAAVTHTATLKPPSTVRWYRSRLALAASLLVAASGVFLWLRQEHRPSEMALNFKRDSDQATNAAPSDNIAIPSEHVAIRKEERQIAGGAAPILTPNVDDAQLLALGKQAELQPTKEAAKFQMNMRSSRSDASKTLDSERMLAELDAKDYGFYSASAEPIETYFVSLAKVKNDNAYSGTWSESQILSADKRKSDNSFGFQMVQSSDASRNLYRWGAENNAPASSPAAKSAIADQPLSQRQASKNEELDRGTYAQKKSATIREYLFRRSDWVQAAIALRGMGIDLPIIHSLDLGDAQDFEGLEKKLAIEAAIPDRPPKLTGAIAEPSDWIRVVVTPD